MTERIYLSPPYVSGNEKEMVGDAIDSNWIAPLGPHVEAFEAELASEVGVGRAIATSSGTGALHLTLDALGVGAGDVVVAPTFTFVGGVSPIRFVGADPWFVDSERSTWNMDPELLEKALVAARSEGRRVGAVISVDLFGQCADYRQIEETCNRYGVPLIEDAAESLGASGEGGAAGSFGRVGILSFNGNKIITTSGGGALVSDDTALLDRALHLATQARDEADHYEHSVIGYNYRMSNLLAAVGRAQLATLSERVDARRRIFETYVDLLGDLDGIEFMPEAPYGRTNRWLTTLTVDPERFGAGRDDVLRALEGENIEGRPVWKPMHRQPAFAGSRVFGGEVSEEFFERGVCLPSGTGLRRDQIERIAGIVRTVGGG